MQINYVVTDDLLYMFNVLRFGTCQDTPGFTVDLLTGTGGMRIVRKSLFNCATTGSCFSYNFTA